MLIKLNRNIYFKETFFKRDEIAQLNPADSKLFIEKGYGVKVDEEKIVKQGLDPKRKEKVIIEEPDVKAKTPKVKGTFLDPKE